MHKSKGFCLFMHRSSKKNDNKWMRNNLNLHWSHALQGFQELVNITSVLNFPESLNSVEIGKGHLALRS